MAEAEQLEKRKCERDTNPVGASGRLVGCVCVCVCVCVFIYVCICLCPSFSKSTEHSPVSDLVVDMPYKYGFVTLSSNSSNRNTVQMCGLYTANLPDLGRRF